VTGTEGSDAKLSRRGGRAGARPARGPQPL